jgi:hypothetical protein
VQIPLIESATCSSLFCIDWMIGSIINFIEALYGTEEKKKSGFLFYFLFLAVEDGKNYQNILVSSITPPFESTY